MPNIFWTSPYRTDKNIARGINEVVIQLQPAPEDWIVHVDHDVMFLLPHSKADIIEVLKNTPFDILGCKTNRLSMCDQVLEEMFQIRDVNAHVAKAKELQLSDKGKVIPTQDSVAAMVMCFRASLWQELGGFEEKLLFDKDFCQRARKAGAQLGIMQGVYVFHLYRWGSPDAGKDIKHLLP